MSDLFALRPYQQAALDAAVAELQDGAVDRCQVISACGTGKTLMSQRIGDALGPGLVVFTAPSIALIDQNLRAWVEQMGGGLPFEPLAVCSDPTVTSKTDLRAEAGGAKPDLRSMFGPAATTDPAEVRARISGRTGRMVIFVTHMSLHVVAEALRSVGETAEVLLVDEAHKTTGPGSAEETESGRPPIGPLVVAGFPAERRVFFTATPRIYSGHSSSDREIIACMTDGGPYGNVVFNYRFSDAVADGWLVPFKLVVSVCNDAQVSRIFSDDPEAVLTYLGIEATARQIGAHLAVERAVVDYSASSILTFHNTVSAARAFARHHPAVAARISAGVTLACAAVSGDTASSARRAHLERFAAGTDRWGSPVDRVMLSNARVLTEGVDVPSIDMVAFCDPKQSVVDITQAIGRAMRPSPGKIEGTVVVPVVIPVGADIDGLLDSTGWRQVREVVAALQSIDEDLAAWFSDIRYEKGTGEDPLLPPAVVVIGDVPPDVHNQIVSKVISLSGPTWESTFGELVVWMARHGRYPSSGSSDLTEARLARWVQTQRQRRHALSLGRVERLESLHGWAWDVRDQRWEAAADDLEDWMACHRSPPSRGSRDPFEATLARWVNNQRSDRAQLSAERVARLESIPGWVWRAR